MPKIKISELPLPLQRSIPYSIKTFSDEYELTDLPEDIQEQVELYLATDRELIDYGLTFDMTPVISHYGDFEVIQNIYDLVIEYLKNYLQIRPESYPWEPRFGCRLKEYISKKDTKLQQTLVSAEIDTLVNVISTDLNIPIETKSLKINKTTSSGYDIIYDVAIILLINKMEKQVTLKIRE